MQVVRNGVASVTNFSLTPIPFFVLMGEVLFHTGVAMKAIDAFDNLISRVPGAAVGDRHRRRHGVLGHLRLDHRHHRAARRAAAAADAQARLRLEDGHGPDHGHRRRRHADPAVGHHRAAGQPGRHLHHRAAGRRRGAGHAAVGTVRRLHRRPLLAQPVAGADLRAAGRGRLGALAPAAAVRDAAGGHLRHRHRRHVGRLGHAHRIGRARRAGHGGGVRGLPLADVGRRCSIRCAAPPPSRG